MNLIWVLTEDGSNTLFNPQFGEHYHSRNGALQESTHVFLNSGLKYFLDQNVTEKASVIEVGFGTGLNFLLSADFCSKNQIDLSYTGIEAYPLDEVMIRKTGYENYIDSNLWESFTTKYADSITSKTLINEFCELQISPGKMQEFTSSQLFDVLYFDAFATANQPELWTDESLSHICNFLKPGGVFVTYAITGNLKRSMKALGFKIQKIPGAAGKREMLRAVKE